MTGNPQSWYDLITMPTMDPRTLISTCIFEDQGAANQTAQFARSTNWLQAVTWVAPPIKVSARTPSTTPFIVASNVQDFASVEFSLMWNATRAMTAISQQLPLVSEGLIFFKSGPFINTIFLDFTPGVTSTDVQLSYRDNSLTGGDFTNAASGTIPVFAFPTSTTYGGLGRSLQLTFAQPGRFSMGLRIVDNSGNYSMFPMEWIVL